MTKINKEDILHVAKLARIGVDDSELDKYAGELIKILNYVDRLNEIDVEDYEPTYVVGENRSIMRRDVASSSYDRDVMLDRAPRRDLVNIRTKGVFNE